MPTALCTSNVAAACPAGSDGENYGKNDKDEMTKKHRRCDTMVKNKNESTHKHHRCDTMVK
ncbi:MAG TPA: hypothetical protein ENI57_00395 [Ignavibacteria bacterium]|nr:hypothetical protein [Ignavibacteria bacterium]